MHNNLFTCADVLASILHDNSFDYVFYEQLRNALMLLLCYNVIGAHVPPTLPL